MPVCQAMTQSETKSHRRWLAPLAWSIAAVAAVLVLLWLSPTAREVVGESSLTVFQIVTAPFILETSLALLGLCIVMAINHYRQEKDGDGWVYLEKREVPGKPDVVADDPPNRHQAVIWQEKPASFDEAATQFEVIEGYLDLGLADDALQELAALPESLGITERADDLHILALAMAGKLSAAARLTDERAASHPERSTRLAKATLAVAGWLHQNNQASSEIDAWLARGTRLDSQAIDALPTGHALRARMDK